MKNVFILLLALSVTACATKPISYEQAKNVDINRIYAHDITKQQANTVKIAVKRDMGFTGSGCYLALVINGRLIADLDTGEKINVYLEPDDYVFAVKSSGVAICGSDILDETEVVVRNGVFKQYRVGFDPANAFIRRTSF
ncbi:MAG: hypothetical protein CFH43_01101 [Proteobacteria bacterium]|nr:MAG: hypothetical protein CFH43_01101 [Pseudomonadota bacterium]